MRRRRRKKIPLSYRQPLIRPGSPNEVWSADFVFDRIASGRTLKCLVIVDDATHEAVPIVVEHTATDWPFTTTIALMTSEPALRRVVPLTRPSPLESGLTSDPVIAEFGNGRMDRHLFSRRQQCRISALGLESSTQLIVGGEWRWAGWRPVATLTRYRKSEIGDLRAHGHLSGVGERPAIRLNKWSFQRGSPCPIITLKSAAITAGSY